LGLPKRFAKNSVVQTENGDYTVGQNLFLSVEEALVALGASQGASRNVAKIVGDKSYAAIVVSPISQAAGKQVVDALNQAAGAGKSRIAFVGHNISRREMEEVAEGVAPVVGLEARK